MVKCEGRVGRWTVKSPLRSSPRPLPRRLRPLRVSATAVVNPKGKNVKRAREGVAALRSRVGAKVPF